MSEMKAVGVARKQEPALVTYINGPGGKRTRVKLVFDHLQFDFAGQHKRLVEGNNHVITRDEILIAPLPLRRDFASRLDATHVEGAQGGEAHVVWMPRGVTVARVVEWPTLEEASQGDGTKRGNNEVIATGYAVCARMDNYQKKEGRHHALTNLLHHPELVGSNKEIIAQCYAERVKKGKKKGKVIAHRDLGDER